MIKTSINLIYFAICSLPYFLITGPFLPDLTVSLVAFFFIIISIKKELWSYYNNIFFKLFLLFYFIINLSAILSENPKVSLETSIPYIRFILFSLAIIFIINNKKNFEIFFLKNLIIVITLLLLDGALHYFSGNSFLGWINKLFDIIIFKENYAIRADYKIQSFFGDEGIYGSYLLRFSPLLFALLLKKKISKKNNLVILIFYFCIFLAILFSGERSSLVLFLLFIIISIALLKIKINTKLLIVFFTFVFLSCVLIFNEKINNRLVVTTKYLFFSLDKERYATNIVKLEEEKGANSKYDSANYYIGLFKTGILMFKDSPLLGKGPRSFKYMSAQERFNSTDINGQKLIYYNSHPHNFYIQFLAEIGLIGFAYFIFLFIFILYIVFFNLRKKYFLKKNYEIIMLSSLFIILWPFITTGNFFSNWLSIFHFFLLGFFFSNVYKNNLFKIK